MIKKPHSALQYLKAITVYCFYATPKMPIQYTLKDLETKITIRNHQLTAKVSCWMSNVKFLQKSKSTWQPKRIFCLGGVFVNAKWI